jgi:site-specific recombinase XerD
MADTPHSPSPTLIEDVRRVLRLHHYSIHTERAYVEWIVRFVRFHRMQSRADLVPAEAKIEAFLTDLAIQGNVAAATQNQAMNALVFLYKRVLNQALEDRINAVRTDKKVNVPVVMTRDEVATVLSLMEGTPQLVAKLLYGSGLRIMEALRARVKTLHQQDLAQGHGAVYLPHALERKYRQTATAWGWQYVFPARHLSVDPRTGITRRHHVDPSVINKAIKVAVRRAGLTKTISVHLFRHSFATHLLQRGTHILQQGGQGVPSPLDDLGG